MVQIKILVQEAHIIVYRASFVSDRKAKLRIIMNNSLSCFGEVFTSRYSFKEEWDKFCIIKYEGDFEEDFSFICGGCKEEFESYHDGVGYNTGFCPKCLDRHETIGLESEE